MGKLEITLIFQRDMIWNSFVGPDLGFATLVAQKASSEPGTMTFFETKGVLETQATEQGGGSCVAAAWSSVGKRHEP